MKRILFFISSKIFWMAVGIIGLAVLIWFFGEMLAIGDIRPLSSTLTKSIAIIILVGVPIAKWLWKGYKNRKINEQLISDISASQQPMLQNIKEDSYIRKQFTEIDNTLKNAKFANKDSFVFDRIFNGQYLYQMPWYVVLGPAGSGKTSVIKQSGLNFPFESSFGSSINAGTVDCDWFLTDDAIFLDTAGRLSLHDSDADVDSYDWHEFIDLLKQYRPKQPINGVILTIGVDELLNNTNNLFELASQLRKRVHEMRIELGINFPVYLTITKLDLIRGFEEFFNGIDEKYRDCTLGFTIPSEKLQKDQSIIVGYISKELGRLKDSLEASYIHLMHDMKNEEDKKSLFSFSDDFEVLNKNLVIFFDGLYKSSKFEENILWRGVYFTSALQEGLRLDPYLDSLSDSFELNKKYNDDLTENKGKSYFIHDLFMRTINEASLADTNLIVSYKLKALRWSGIALFTGGGLLISAILINSYFNNNNYLDHVDKSVEKISKELSSEESTKNLFHAISMATDIKNSSHNEGNFDLGNPPFSYKLGLYQGKSMGEVSNATYQRGLRETVLPLINYKLDELLHKSLDSNEVNSYDALKAYLMLYNTENYDPDFMEQWILKHMYKESKSLSKEKNQQVKEVLKYVLLPDVVSPNLPYDAELVDQVRQSIAVTDISTMIINNTYQSLKNKVNEDGSPLVKPVSFQSMGGIQSRLIFKRKSGKSLSEPIDDVYTKKAYVEFILPELLKMSAKMHLEEDWVMGEYSSKQKNEKEALNNAKLEYYQKYASAWTKYINDLTIKSPRNIDEAKSLVKIISDAKDSPLRKIIQGISDNTTLDLSNQLNDKSKEKLSGLAQQLLNKAGLDRVAETAKDTNLLKAIDTKTLVDERFIDYSYLTYQKDGKEARINAVIESANGFYQYLDELKIAIDKGVTLPPINAVVEFRGEVSRLPHPFREVFENLSDQVLNVWDNEISDRELDKENARLEKERLLAEEEERQKKLQEEEAQKLQQETENNNIFSSLSSVYKPLVKKCDVMVKTKYPFKKDGSYLPIDNFKQFFERQSYIALLTTPLPKPAPIALVLDEEGEEKQPEPKKNQKNYEQFLQAKKLDNLNEIFFNRAGVLGFDYSVQIVKLDKRLSSLSINIDKKNLEYSHGPITTLSNHWPTTSESEISVFLNDNLKQVGQLKKKGEWSIYELIDSGTVSKSTDKNLIVDYDIDGYKFSLEFLTNYEVNPLDINIFRKFTCPETHSE